MSEAKHILCLVDACYGGLTLNTRGLKKDKSPEYLKRMTRERGRQVITAGGKDEQVIEKPEWGHSAFTRNLLKGLGDGLADENDDGIITGDELGGFIKNRVVVDVDGAHTPQKGRIGSDMGEFVFISKMLDEPFAGIDPVTVQSIQGIIQNLRDQDIAILITDHAAREILEIVDRCYVINEGTVLCHGKPDQVRNHPEVRSKYLGDFDGSVSAA